MSDTTQVPNISEDDFREFMDIRNGGTYNMLSSAVRESIGWTKQEHLYVLQHCEELEEKFNIHPE